MIANTDTETENVRNASCSQIPQKTCPDYRQNNLVFVSINYIQ